MNSNSLDDWLDYIDQNRPKEDEFGLNRLRPIKSGRRISLVRWYGGPNFR